MNYTAEIILDRKRDSGPDAFLWANTSGDVILWPDEVSSEGDDGSKALARWQVSDETLNYLIDGGALDDIC